MKTPLDKTSQNNYSDSWGIWACRLVRKRRQFAEVFWGLHTKVNCFLWRVSMGRGCRFWGKILLNRAPGSTIEVGSSCRFRSAVWSNMIGINRPCMLSTLRPSAKIIIGKNNGFSGTAISAAESITIGDGVISGANVTITDTDWHHVDRLTNNMNYPPTAPINIGDNVWIGMNVTVLKGVTIGQNAVISSNSVVIHDIPENVIAAGQPAKVVRNTQEEQQ